MTPYGMLLFPPPIIGLGVTVISLLLPAGFVIHGWLANETTVRRQPWTCFTR